MPVIVLLSDISLLNLLAHLSNCSNNKSPIASINSENKLDFLPSAFVFFKVYWKLVLLNVSAINSSKLVNPYSLDLGLSFLTFSNILWSCSIAFFSLAVSFYLNPGINPFFSIL